MNPSIKNALGVFLIIGLLSLSYASISFVGEFGRSIEPSSFRSFWVSAEGEAVTVPDIAMFSFSVITDGGTDIAALQKENAEKMNAGITFLKVLKIKEEDITTQSYNLNPRYSRSKCDFGDGKPCPPPEIVGYSIRQSVSVKIRNFDNISKAMSGIVDAGANSVGSLSFTIDDPTSVQDEAREEAIDKAKVKARAMAKAADFNLGRLLEISEDRYASPAPRGFAETAMVKLQADDSAIAPSIEPGSQEVRVSIRLKYEID